MNTRINFLISAICENSKYIEYIRFDSELTIDTKTETIIKISNIIINNALELQHLIKQNETIN